MDLGFTPLRVGIAFCGKEAHGRTVELFEAFAPREPDRRGGGGDAHQFWCQFCGEEKFLLKGLEGEAQHALKLLQGGAEVERAVKYLVDSTDFWNLRTTRLAAILGYLREMTVHLPHWAAYQDALAQLAIGVEHHRD